MQLQTKILLEKCPDCVLFDQQSNFLWVATYSLDDDANQQKSGQILKIQNQEIQSQLDLNAGITHLSLHDDKVIAIDSNGNLKLIQQDLQPHIDFQVSQNCLSYFSQNNNNLLITSATGETFLFDLETQNLLFNKQIHEYELWFAYLDSNVAYIPGEFGSLKLYDTNSYTQIQKLNVSEEDICSITIQDNYLYLGSFNQSLYQLDLRTNRVINQWQFPGGIWRHEVKQQDCIAACMQGGFAKQNLQTKQQEIVPTESLAYGLTQNEDTYFIASFYEKAIYLVNIN